MSDDIKKQLGAVIDSYKEDLCQMADEIFDLAEISGEEYRTSDILCSYLEKEGFKVERGTGLEVILCDERMSTVASERVLMEGNVRREDRKTYIDKMAAAFILQGYLDYQSFSENQAESEDSEDI